MPKLWRAAAVAWLGVLVAAASARAQSEADFTVIRDWSPIGAVDFRAVADTLVLTSGTIHSNETYGDLVFRFDYRLPSPRARAALLVRSHVAGDGAAREYTVALDGVGSSGQLSATGIAFAERRFTPRAGPAREWTPCEVRIEHDRLTVAIDGAVLSEADRLDPADGRLGFRVVSEGIELRGMRVARPPAGPPKPPPTFHPELPQPTSPGVVLPTLVKRAPPMYPADLRRRAITGEVMLAVEVTADGRPGDMHVMATAHPDLVPPALECVRKWRFRPATRDGVPTGIVVTVEVAFNLAR